MQKREWTIFLNNAEQKIILSRMLEIVYAENNEQFFMRKQWTVLVNAENRFYDNLFLSTATMPLNFLFWWFFGLDLKSLYFTMKYLNKN